MRTEPAQRFAPDRIERPFPLERPLDTTESIFHAFDAMGTFVTVQVAAVRGPLTEGLLRLAAARVQARHPVLRARVLLDGAAPRWRTPEEAPVPVVLRATGAEIAGLLEEELHRPFRLADEPPWRCLLVPASAAGQPACVLLGCSHVAADGKSASVVLLDLLAECAAAVEGRPSLPLQPPPAPLDDLLRPPDLRGWAGHKLSRAAQMLLAPAVRLRREPAGAPLRSRFASAVVPPERLQALLARARREGSTVTGALTAALVAAVRVHLAAGPLAQIGHTVSLRDLARVSPDAVGCYVSGLATRHLAGGHRAFWGVARDASRRLRRAMRRGDMVAGIEATRGRYREYAEWVRQVAAREGGTGRTGGVTLSNRGSLPERQLGPFRLEGWSSATSNHNGGNLLQLSVGTCGGALSCGLVHVEPLVSKETADAFLRTVLGELEAAAA